MRSFIRTIASASSLLMGVSPGLATCNSSNQPMQVGAVTGDSEKDSFGVDCAGFEVAQTGSISGAAPAQITEIGPRFADPEKQTFGYSAFFPSKAARRASH